MSGWIKLHRSVLNNDIYRFDPTAWRVFEHLLLNTNKLNGTCTYGRKQLSLQIGNNESTTYKALKRLEKAKMVTLSSNSRFTTIRICNWSEYQGNGNSPSNSSVTMEEQQSNSGVTHYKKKNKEIRIEKTIKSNDVVVQRIYDYYIEQFGNNPNTYKLTDSRKQKIRKRLGDAGDEMLRLAIKNTSYSDWHRGDNDRNWKADLDFIIRSYEQVEKLAGLETTSEETSKLKSLEEYA